MASMMPPPMVPSYSLRVQIFAPDAYGEEDKPLRNIRVVTDPSKTIQQFCEQAVRQQTAAYGNEIAVKKCQDELGYDVMQSELVGNLFTSGSTIRIVQAYAQPSMRDSVPPTSALRFEPQHMLGKRRDRPDSSPKTNGILPAPPNSYKPNKRQRIADLNPDHPLPSLEEEPAQNGETAESILIPNSQESVDLGAHLAAGRNGSSQSSAVRNHVLHEIPESSPVVEAQQRGRSASLHLQKVGESRRSASAPKQVPNHESTVTNGFADIEPGFSKKSSRVGTGRSSNVKEDVYDQMPNGDEGAAVLKAKKAELNKLKHTPSNGRFDTPPSLKRPTRDGSTPGELPLTPNSKREVQRQKDAAEEAKRARIAAAEAAEQRRKESAEAQRLERARQQEQERSDLEKRMRAEAEEQRLAKIAREEAARQEKEALQASQERRIAEGLVEAEKVLSTEFEMDPPVNERAKDTRSALKKHRKEARSTSSNSTSPVASRDDAERSNVPRRSTSAISSTPFIPSGRKSALKSSPMRSPALSSPTFTGVGIEHNMPMPKPRERKVSFHNIPDDKDTPSRPTVRSQVVVTPHPSAGRKSVPASAVTNGEADLINSVTRKQRTSVSEDVKSTLIPPPRRSVSLRKDSEELPTAKVSENAARSKGKSKSITPVPVPKSITPRSSMSTEKKAPLSSTVKTITPTVKPEKTASKAPKASTPVPAPRSASGAILPGSRTRIIPGAKPVFKAKVEVQEVHKDLAASPRPQTKIAPPSIIRPPPSVRNRSSDTKSPVPSVQQKAQLEASASKTKSKPAAPALRPASSSGNDSTSDEDDAESVSESDSDAESEEAQADDGGGPPNPSTVAVKARTATPQPPPAQSTTTRRSSTPKSAHVSPALTSNSNTTKPLLAPPTARPRSSSPKSATSSNTGAQSRGTPQNDEQADVETQSLDTSSRDSRSPVVFTQREQEEQNRINALRSKAAIQDDEESSSSDDDDDEDVEMQESHVHDVPKVDSPAIDKEDDIEMPDAQTHAELDSPSSSFASNSDNDLPVPKLATKSNKQPPLPSSQASNLLKTSSHQSLDTQDEVDYQLISSVYEASSPASRPSLTQPALSRVNNRVAKTSHSSPVRPPAIGFGSSLSLMNLKKSIPSSSAPIKGALKSGTGKPLLKSTGQGSEDETSESDDDDSDAESIPATTNKNVVNNVGNKQKLQTMMDEPTSEDGSESGSDSASESEAEVEEESEATKIRRELMLEVSRLHAKQAASQTQS